MFGSFPRRVIPVVSTAATMTVLIVLASIVQSDLVLANLTHTVVDLAGYAVGVTSVELTKRSRIRRHNTFGLARLDVLAGMAFGLLLIVAAAAIGLQALLHASAGSEPHTAVLWLATAAVGFNALVAAVALRDHSTHSLVDHGNTIHAISDFAGFLITALATLLANLANSDLAVQLASIAVAVIVAFSAAGLVRRSAGILMERAPRHLDPASVAAAILEIEGVEALHHLHLWQIDSHSLSLSGHLVLAETSSVHESQLITADVKQLLLARFAIDHATLEVECHSCDAPRHPLA